MPVIETDDLRKYYGKVQALKGVSLQVEPGEIYGLLGQNGAGKTTLIKILLGIVRKTDGSAWLLGNSAGAASARRNVGYLPEDHRFPEYHTAWTLLDFYGQLYGVPRSDRRRRAEAALEVVGLKGRMHTKIRTYSKGMKQRVGIAQAIFHGPDVIFLDEPTDGVDPLGRREIRDLMLRLKGEGHTIFLNSHLLGEVELVCDRVGILSRGLMVREGDVRSLTEKRGEYQVRLAPGQAFPADELKNKGYNVRQAGDLWEVELADGQTIDPVLGLLHERRLNLRHLVEKKQTLEDAFLATVEAAEPGIDEAPVVRPAGDRVRRADR